MYRVRGLLRDARAHATAVGLSTARASLHSGLCGGVATAASSGVAASSAPPPPAAPAKAPFVPPVRRRRTVSEACAPTNRPLVFVSKHAVSLATGGAGSAPVDPATAPPHVWRKLPHDQKWAHLQKGVFHLVAPREDPSRPGKGPEFDLMRGVHSNLFKREATIHRIIAYESDLAEESTRDTTATAEVVLVGRSNVGKSSLINALLVNGGERVQLATTSKTPGRTQLLFMFSFKDERNARLVDCPGYGYAKVRATKSEAWNKLMGLYLRKRAAQGILKRVMVLIDVRRGIGPLDEAFMKFLEMETMPYQIVLTKVDSVTPSVFAKQLDDVREHLLSMPQGRYNTDQARDEYDQRMSGKEDQDDEQWQTDVNTGEYSATSLSTDGSALPSYSCSIPIIHAVSARHELGVASLQQSMTRMLTLEKNLKNRAYRHEGQEEKAGAELTQGDADAAYEHDNVADDDGMGNPDEDEDEFIPHIPVSHYDPAQPEPASNRKVPAKKRSKFGARSGSFGSGRRNFSTSAPRRARAASTPPATSDAPTTKAPRKTRAKKADGATSSDATSAAPKKPRAPRSRSTPPVSRSSSSDTISAQPLSSSSAAPTTAASSSSSSSVDSSSPSDAHLGSMYQKKSQRQHILDRSETYIGSMHHQHSAQWVCADNGPDASAAIVQKECVFMPSLVHIFDEILVNAADNQHRVSSVTNADGTVGTSQPMSTIRVDIDESIGRISIFNDGASIPIAMHPQEGIPIPELIFGHLLTSSNYNDKEKRFTGGRHGYGAKLTNIFSREFTVELQDVARRMRYKQTFRNNMSEKSMPIQESFDTLTNVSKKELATNYTRISFTPDFARFNEPGLTKDTIGIMRKRVYDIAACVNTNIAIQKAQEKTRKTTNNNADDTAAEPAVKRINVYLNGTLLEVNSFPKYLDLFPSPPPEVDGKWVFASVNSNWQIGVGPNVAASSPIASSSIAVADIATPITPLPSATRDISFVNSIYTSRGGSHVTHVSDRISRAITDHILRTQKTITREMIPPSLVKEHMSLLVNCKIPNPSFSSQTKESLMTPVKDFGSECTLSAAFLTQITSNATGIVPAIVDSILSRQQMMLLKKSRQNTKRGKVLNIPKLDDAHWAGHADSEKAKQTTLILTEGDSAKALVLSSLAILGRDKFGVFPLKGKLLNVRDASLKQVMDNAEIQNLLAILGLEIDAKYYEPGSAAAAACDPSKRPSKPLRYGRIMLMTDQDHDGSHIKGLFINLLHTFWPELLQSSNFLEEFVTAIIKVRVTKTKQVLSFQTQTEFETWKTTLPVDVRENQDKFKRAYTIKYYKGLGTNTNEEGKEYFRNIAKHRVKFLWGVGLPVADQPKLATKRTKQTKQLAAAATNGAPAQSLLPASNSDAGSWIRLAFAKEQADARKEWLQKCYNSSLFVDTTSLSLPIADFINKELIIFSHADNIRSIPSVLDGLKPVQRKILFGCFKRNLKNEIKVAQLSGYISEQTMYHHGEVSLQGSIINMAQSFIGSNNIALLVSSGQFGSRNMGGKDAAAARYIFTNVSLITRTIFHPHDDALLKHGDEDGITVEPDYYVPIIPTVLVNGAEGIGTGFSTFVPTFNPRDIIENLRALLSSQPMRLMHPWVRGWRGLLKPSAEVDGVITNYATEGIVQLVNPTTIEVRELPIGRWPDEFKTILNDLQSEGSIRRFYDQSTDDAILYRIEVTREQALTAERVGLLKFFKLASSLSLNNMHLFDARGLMHRYARAQDILADFSVVRLEYYRRRREHLMIALQVELRRAQSKTRFIGAVTSGKLQVYNKKKRDLMDELRASGYETAADLMPRFPIYKDHTHSPALSHTHDALVVKGAPLDADSYDYLLNMPLSTLTLERMQALQVEHDTAAKQLAAMEKATPKSLWLQDLDKLDQQWADLEHSHQRGGKRAPRIADAEIVEEEDA